MARPARGELASFRGRTTAPTVGGWWGIRLYLSLLVCPQGGDFHVVDAHAFDAGDADVGDAFRTRSDAGAGGRLCTATDEVDAAFHRADCRYLTEAVVQSSYIKLAEVTPTDIAPGVFINELTIAVSIAAFVLALSIAPQ